MSHLQVDLACPQEVVTTRQPVTVKQGQNSTRQDAGWAGSRYQDAQVLASRQASKQAGE